MGEIIPYIYKSELPRGHQWALLYSRVAACFQPSEDRNLYLHCYFSWRKDDRKRLLDDRRELQLVILAFPYRRWLQGETARDPWFGQSDALVVDVSVGAIDRSTVRESTLRTYPTWR